MKLKDAAAALDVSAQTMWRIENGLTSTRTSDVLHLCTLYGVPDKMREVFVGLARETKSKGWWHAYGDVVPAWFELYVGLEQAAATIRTYAPALVPGLLQSREYMGSVIRADRPGLSDADVDTRVRLKLSRQQLLTRSFPEPPQIEAIISEAVLMAEPEPESAMRSQVWHLLKATELDNISIKVLPTARGPRRASVGGAFTLLDFRQENGNTPPATVYAENLTGAIYLDKPSEITVYGEVWESIESKALDEPASIALMSSVLKELNDREPA